MFVDTAIITIRSGRGGDGCCHFLRLKGNAKGGPDGGDGGKGGDVIAVADEHLDTLVQFAYRTHWFSACGEPGLGKRQAGKASPDLEVPLPLGTQAFDVATGELIAEITRAGDRVILARGGEGGFGNDHFKSAVHQTPQETTPGGDASEMQLRLELRLIADVGLVGLPNAGKSTWLKASTRANPKSADYPFTTLSPQLGIAALSDERRLVIADLPGLIEGASQGIGLGHDFLRHIERTRVILHVVNAFPEDGSDPLANHRIIRRELADFSDALARKPEIVVINKTDLLPEDERDERISGLVSRFRKERGVTAMAASAATGQGVREATEAVWSLAKGVEIEPASTPRRTC